MYITEQYLLLMLNQQQKSHMGFYNTQENVAFIMSMLLDLLANQDLDIKPKKIEIINDNLKEQPYQLYKQKIQEKQPKNPKAAISLIKGTFKSDTNKLFFEAYLNHLYQKQLVAITPITDSLASKFNQHPVKYQVDTNYLNEVINMINQELSSPSQDKQKEALICLMILTPLYKFYFTKDQQKQYEPTIKKIKQGSMYKFIRIIKLFDQSSNSTFMIPLIG